MVYSDTGQYIHCTDSEALSHGYSITDTILMNGMSYNILDASTNIVFTELAENKMLCWSIENYSPTIL